VSKWTKFGAVAVAVAMAAGCGGDNGGGGQDLTTSEKQALVEALATTEFGGLAAFVVEVVGEVGTLDAATVNSALTQALDGALSLSSVGSQSPDYEGAVGIAIQFDYDVQGEVSQGWFYGVFGWNDINASAGTVGEWLLIGGAGDVGTLPSSTSGTVEEGDVFVYYSSNDTPYFGLTGKASVSSSSFSGSTDCGASQQGFTIDCSYAAGTMNGDFSFTAENEGGDPYEQTGIVFSSLPAVRMNLSVTDQ